MKTYFLATSIGQWSPQKYKKTVEDILFEKAAKKNREVKKIKEIFANNFEILQNFRNHPQWGIIENQIKKRLKTLKRKLFSEEGEEEYNSYCKRLISPWSSYPMVIYGMIAWL